MPYYFKTAPLPKPVYTLLQQIAQAEILSQREVVVAGVLALARLRQIAPDQASDVIREARALTAKHAPADQSV